MRIALATMLLASCTLVTDLDGYECQTDLDCSAGRVCSANNFCLLSSEAPECVRADQCAMGELCTNGKCETEETARWGCVGSEAEAPNPGSKKVTLRLKLVPRASGETASIGGAVTALACTVPTCDKMEGPFTPDKTGVVEVVVNQGFEGFIKLTGKDFLDTYYQLQTPLNADRPAAVEVTMLSASDVSEIAQAAGAKVSLSERGVVLFEILDCLGDRSKDVSVAKSTKDSEVDIVYLAAGQNVDSTASATSAAGMALALDVAAGSPDFKLTRQSSKAGLGSLTVSTIAGAVTYVPYQFGR